MLFVRSIIARRSFLENVDARYFLEPVHLGGQPADLCVQFLELALVGSFFGTLLLSVFLEKLSKMIGGLLFPAMQLVRIYTVLGSNLSDGSLFLENFEHNLGFLLCGKASSHGSQSNLFWSLFVSKFP